jgi:hypothetical protein
MNWRHHTLAPDAAAVLNQLVEPLAGYIGATTSPRATLEAALSILVDTLGEIDADATTYLASRCPIQIE